MINNIKLELLSGQKTGNFTIMNREYCSIDVLPRRTVIDSKTRAELHKELDKMIAKTNGVYYYE